MFFTEKKSDEVQQDLEEKVPKLIASEEETVDDDIHTFTNEHTNKYEGTITRSRTKRVENTFLLKTNILMSNHFIDDWYESLLCKNFLKNVK